MDVLSAKRLLAMSSSEDGMRGSSAKRGVVVCSGFGEGRCRLLRPTGNLLAGYSKRGIRCNACIKRIIAALWKQPQMVSVHGLYAGVVQLVLKPLAARWSSRGKPPAGLGRSR